MATFEELGFPEPKFRMGEKVWCCWPSRRQVKVDCPDCLGKKRWKAITPAGEEFEVSCPRCSGGYSTVTRLGYDEPEMCVRELHIGSIEFRSTNELGQQYAYMCRETGIGSGSVYYEDALYHTREEALIAGDAKLVKLKAEDAVRYPENAFRKEVSFYRFETVLLREKEEENREQRYKIEHLLDELNNLRYETLKPTYEWQREISEQQIVEFLNTALEKAGFEKLEVCKC